MIRRLLDYVTHERVIQVEKTIKHIRYRIPIRDDDIGDSLKVKIVDNEIVLTFMTKPVQDMIIINKIIDKE
jgi:hypothetical protein